jgi:uncharacterized membrane protein YeaQ/YmgE (transglycosylase-associated protein family)
MTIALWIIVGVALGLFVPMVMPTPVSHGRTAAVFVGLISSLIGGALGAFITNAPLTLFGGPSAGTAVIAALYVLYTYQCLQMRRA